MRVGVCILVASVLLLPAGAWAAGAGSTEDELKAEARLFKLINDFRVGQGVEAGALVDHNAIIREARKHSNYMANHGELSHDRLDERKANLAAADAGIDPEKLCEATGLAPGYERPRVVAKLILRAWKKAKSTRECLLDAAGYTTESGGVGVQRVEDDWYVTFIAADDATP